MLPYINIQRLPFWVLGIVLGSGQGIASMLVLGKEFRHHGFISAIWSSVIGNMILWFIGLGIISMTSPKGNALENIKNHFDTISSKIAAIVIASAFIIWYALHINLPAQLSVIPLP